MTLAMPSIAVVVLAVGLCLPAAAAPLYRVELVTPNATGSGQARAVNARGDVAGQFNDAAFVWHAGHFTSFPGVQFSGMDGTYTSTATAIDRDGVAVGNDGSYSPCSMSGLERAIAVRFEADTMRFIDRSRDGECTFEADGINDRGTIVGESGFRGFVRFADGHQVEVAPLSTRPENNGTRASAIDNEGHVVGGTTIDVANVPQIKVGEWTPNGGGRTRYVYGPDPTAYPIHAYLLTLTGQRQHMRDLGTIAGFPNTYATALNEDLTIVGYSGVQSGAKWTRVSGPSHAWVWQHGSMTDIGKSTIGIGVTGARSADRTVNSFAYGVNDAGIIVGCSGKNAVRWVHKRMQNLNALIDPHSGWSLSCAKAINRDGIIVGTGAFGKSGSLPFRLVPLSPHR